MKLSLFKKADIIIAVVLVAICVAGTFAALPSKDPGQTAVVTVDGAEVERIDLSGDQDAVIETQYGVNTVTVKDGYVYISESDCRGQDCVRMGGISRPGQMIVCLPHHLTVTIEGGSSDPDAPDAVIK